MQQYGQPMQQTPPTQQYGQPAPMPYGQQPMPQAVPTPLPAVVKWGGLSVGGFKVPVIRFIGKLTDMVYDSTTMGLRIVEKFDQVQILESPAPWPWATLDLSVKYSDREDSGWGRHVSSAKTLGIALNAQSLDEARNELIGKIYEMHQQEESYGEDQKTGQKFKGDVWRFVRIVMPGQPIQQQAPQPQYAPPIQQYAPPPGAVPMQQAAPVSVAPQPQTAGFNATIDPNDTAPVRAKKLLHGKTLNEFLGVALVDDKIKADTAFTNSIFDQSFIVGLKASGQVVLSPDGKHNVVA